MRASPAALAAACAVCYSSFSDTDQCSSVAVYNAAFHQQVRGESSYVGHLCDVQACYAGYGVC